MPRGPEPRLPTQSWVGGQEGPGGLWPLLFPGQGWSGRGKGLSPLLCTQTSLLVGEDDSLEKRV